MPLMESRRQMAPRKAIEMSKRVFLMLLGAAIGVYGTVILYGINSKIAVGVLLCLWGNNLLELTKERLKK